MVLRARQSIARYPLVTAAGAFLALRVFDLIVFAAVARHRGMTLRDQLLSWDSGWLLNAALNGWPHELPRDANGAVEQSTLPWPPLVPLAVRAASSILGDRGADAALVGMNLIGGLCSAVLLCLILMPYLGRVRAVGASILWSALPATPVLVMGYSEGVFTAFAFGALWAMTRDRYVLAGLLLVPAGLTKVTVVPFAVTLAVAVVVYRRRQDSAHMPWWRLLTVLALAGVSTVAWPAILAVRVGAWDAISQSHSAWGRDATPFGDVDDWLVSAVTDPSVNAWIGIAVMAAYLVAAVVVARDRRYPTAFRVLAVASPVFLLWAGPFISTARGVLPDPALSAAIQSWIRRGWVFGVVVAGLALLGVGWILVFAAAGPGQPPP